MKALLLTAILAVSPYRLETFGVSAIISQHFYNTLVAGGFCAVTQRVEQKRVIRVCSLRNGFELWR